MGVAYNPRVVTDGLVACYDFGNTKKSYSPNVHPGSTNIYDWYVDIRGNANANNCTIAKDTIASPVGNTPLRMDITGDDPHIGSYSSNQWNLDEASAGETWTVSVYAKATVNTTCQIFIFGTPSTGSYVEAPAGTINITTEWQRISYTHTFTNANTDFIQSRLDGTPSGGAGESIWFDGWQVERGTTTSNFTSDYTSGDVLDISKNTNNGTIVSTPQYNNSNGGYITFDALDDYIDLGSTIRMSRAGSTCEFWMNKNTDARKSFLTFQQGSYISHVEVYTNKFITETKNNCNIFDSPTFTFNTGEWYHICFKFDSNRSYWYVNGESIGETPGYGYDNCNTSTNPGELLDDFDFRYIGENTAYSGHYSGSLTAFKVYNRALSNDEVKQNFNATRGRFGI